MSNPFEDPSVRMAASSPATANQLNMAPPKAFSPMPPAPSATKSTPVASTSYNSNISAPPVSTTGAPPLTPQSPRKNENLMEEIGSSIKATNSSTILKVMRLTNIVLSAATISAGVLAWVAGYVTSFQTFIASIYIILFGFLLLGFELRTEKFDVIMQQNFGFMYGYKTRTIFLLFIAIWPLSMGKYWVTILDAVLLFLNAFFNFFVVYHHPAFATPAPPSYDSKQEMMNSRV